MRVCNVCLTHDPAYGGLHRSVQDFSRALSASVLSFDDGPVDDGLGERVSVEEGVPVRRLGCGTGWLARDCRVMSPAVARQADAAVADADLLVVHSLFRGHATWARAWARQHRRRYWAVPHGCLDPWGLSHRGLLKRLWLETWGRSFLADADRIVFSSQRSMEKASPGLSDSSADERVVVVHWPVDLPQLDGQVAARAAFRQQLGIPEAARLLLFVGRLHAVKRPLETVRAFCEATAAAALKHCHLAIVGMDGDLTQADILAAIPPACRDRVHVIGPLAGDDLAAALLASDGFVSLSFQENFGYAAAEAVASAWAMAGLIAEQIVSGVGCARVCVRSEGGGEAAVAASLAHLLPRAPCAWPRAPHFLRREAAASRARRGAVPLPAGCAS